MPFLDPRVRNLLEETVDFVLKNPKEVESTFAFMLHAMGIKSNLEAILSFTTGLLFETVQATYATTYHRSLDKEEIFEVASLLKRRAWEIRQAFLFERVEK